MPVIFEHIDNLLEELDQFQTNKLLASQVNTENINCKLSTSVKVATEVIQTSQDLEAATVSKSLLNSQATSINLLANIAAFTTLLIVIKGYIAAMKLENVADCRLEILNHCVMPWSSIVWYQ